jgi:hypothetical protein
MSNNPSNLREEDLVIAQVGEPAPCPCCGITDLEKLGLSLMDQVLRSHAELRKALRLAGRLVLRSERQDHHSLEQIRGALKRAENISKSLNIRDDLPEDHMEKLFLAAPTVAEVTTDRAVNVGLVKKSVPKRTRLTRPHSLRIIKSPAS